MQIMVVPLFELVSRLGSANRLSGLVFPLPGQRHHNFPAAPAFLNYTQGTAGSSSNRWLRTNQVLASDLDTLIGTIPRWIGHHQLPHHVECLFVAPWS